jgi:hypothetical protein
MLRLREAEMRAQGLKTGVTYTDPTVRRRCAT